MVQDVTVRDVTVKDVKVRLLTAFQVFAGVNGYDNQKKNQRSMGGGHSTGLTGDVTR